MVEEILGWRRVTLGADKGYDRKELVQELREHQVTPHFALKDTSIIDQRTTPVENSHLKQKFKKIAIFQRPASAMAAWHLTANGRYQPSLLIVPIRGLEAGTE